MYFNFENFYLTRFQFRKFVFGKISSFSQKRKPDSTSGITSLSDLLHQKNGQF